MTDLLRSNKWFAPLVWALGATTAFALLSWWIEAVPYSSHPIELVVVGVVVFVGTFLADRKAPSGRRLLIQALVWAVVIAIPLLITEVLRK